MDLSNASEKNSPVTRPGIDPGTIRLVAQRLSHYANPGPSSGGGARYSVPFQTGPGAHPVPYTMDTGSSPRLMRPARGLNHPQPF